MLKSTRRSPSNRTIAGMLASARDVREETECPGAKMGAESVRLLEGVNLRLDHGTVIFIGTVRGSSEREAAADGPCEAGAMGVDNQLQLLSDEP